MSSFPPSKWEVRFLKDLDTLEGTPLEEEQVSLDALLAVRPAQGEEGSFRFAISGDAAIQLNLDPEELLQDARFNNMTIHLEMKPGEQVFQL